MSKYEYYQGINLNSERIHEHLFKIEKEKKGHHEILVRVLSYLSLSEILRISHTNRKLYIVSGDITLLRNFTKQEQLNEEKHLHHHKVYS